MIAGYAEAGEYVTLEQAARGVPMREILGPASDGWRRIAESYGRSPDGALLYRVESVRDALGGLSHGDRRGARVSPRVRALLADLAALGWEVDESDCRLDVLFVSWLAEPCEGYPSRYAGAMAGERVGELI